MKKRILCFFVLYASFSFAQVSPTLAVGLETLTMNKGTIDVKVLTEIIVAKQKELKQEALRRFMYKLFPEANYTTKFYVQNCLNTLLNEKNPQVIEKEILELTTNYALSLGVAYAFVKTESDDDMLKHLNEVYDAYKFHSSYYQENAIKQLTYDTNFATAIADLKKEIYQLENTIVSQLKKPQDDQPFKKTLMAKKQELDRKKKELSKLVLKQNIKDQSTVLNSSKKERAVTLIGNLKPIYNDNPEAISNLDQIKTYLNEIASLYADKNTSEATISSKVQQVASLIEKVKSAKESKGEIITQLNVLKKEINEFKPTIPFGIVLDVVSLSLSNVKELKEKGFFKREIDYRNDLFYQNLTNSSALSDVEVQNFKTKLDELKVYFENKITLYAQNYDVIKEFIQKNKNASTGQIKTMLLNASIDEALSFMQSKSDDIEWLKSLNTTNDPLLNTTIAKVIETNGHIKNVSDLGVKLAAIQSKLKNELTNGATTDQASKVKTLITDLKKNSTIAELKRSASAIEAVFANASFSPIPEAIPTNDSINKIINAGLENINLLLVSRKSLADLKTIKEKLVALKNTLPETVTYLDATIQSVDVVLMPLLQLNQQLSDFKEASDKLKTLYKESNTGNFSTIITFSNTFKSKYLDVELNAILNHILSPQNSKNEGFNTDKLDNLTISKAAQVLPELYLKIKNLLNNDNVKLQDIVYLEDYVMTKMIELKIRDKNNDAIYTQIIDDMKKIIPLFKLRIIEHIDDIGAYNEELLTLFEFIGNLNKLDKAETYQSIIDMLRDGSKKVENNLTDGSFKEQYILFVNAIKKYTIINPSAQKQYVEVDVVSFLNDLQQYYSRNNKSNFGLYLTLGLNQNFFVDKFRFPDSDEAIKNISFASEKIGLKYRFLNFKQYNGYENVIQNDVYLNKKAPFVNEFYGIFYGSGLLYSLANTTNNKNFNFAHLGLGLGIRFYNSLDVNAIVGFPFVKDSNFGDHAFFGFGFDIPLGEYLEKLGNKN